MSVIETALKNKVKSLEEKLEQYKKTLEFYGSEKSWEKKYDGHMGFHTWDPSDIENDKGQKARDILAKVKGV